MNRPRLPLFACSLLALASLGGCPAASPPGPEPCEAQRGYLELCATYFGEVAEGSVTVRVDSEDSLPIESLLDADGCTSVQLSSGSYEWSAQHLTDSCVTSYEPVVIGNCEEVTELSVELGDWCTDGR
jgi:hypothetical protein